MSAMIEPTVQKEQLVGGEIPPLPEHATHEEKDAHWYRYVYQGDRMPQLTVRAVVMGGALGMLMAASNLYTTLKVGWAFGVAITACVMSFVLWNFLRVLSGGRLSQMSILENNCMQSTASAAGYSTGSTIATCFGALLMIQGVHMGWPVVAAFTFLTGAMGVFLAIPMKRQMINQEQLAFPSGILAAVTLKSLHSHGREAAQKAYSLVIAMACGMIVGILNTAEGSLVFLDRFFAWVKARVFNIHLPELVPAEGFAKVEGKQLINFGFEPSVLLVAAGMIVGLRVSLSMLAGALILYLVAGPLMLHADAAHAGEAGYVPSIQLVAGGTIAHLPRWALWGGTSIMVFASLTSVALQWRTISRSFTLFKRGTSQSASLSAQLAAIEVPTAWLVAGMIPIALGMLLLQVLAFQISWWSGAIAIALSFVLALVACRATGETDTTPIGAMGKVMQFLFAVLHPGQVVPNLISAGIGANSASSSADLLTDLKSGYLLGANPRKQFLAQFFGLFFGTLIIVPAWYLMVPDKAALEKFNPPATNTWVAVARALTEGLHTIPLTARWAILYGGLLGVALPIIERLVPTKSRKFLPSAVGLGLSWVVFFTNAFAFAIGAVVAYAWSLLHKKSHDAFMGPVASGLVAGESLMKAIIAMMATAIGLWAARGGQ
jgi:putative OPT family oligopeptide transporter